MKRGGRRIWIMLAAAGLAVGLSASWGFGSLMVQPSPSGVPPARAPARDLWIRSSDGLMLAATYWPGRLPRSPAILLLHGNRSSRAAMADEAAWLVSRGYAVLTVDFRGCGESAAPPHSFGLFESRDAEAAFAWLKRRQKGAPVAIIGVSLGGAAALLGEGGPIPADALVLQGVYPDIRHAIRDRIAASIRNRIAASSAPAAAYVLEPLLSLQSKPRFGVWPASLSPIDWVGDYGGPVLVVGGAADRSTPAEETRAMFAAARGPKLLWIEPRADHEVVSSLRSRPYRLLLLHFLHAHIGSPAAAERTKSP